MQLRAARLFSRHIVVSLGGVEIATIRDKWLVEGSTLWIQGTEFVLRRESLLSGNYLLLQGGLEVARGEKPSFVSRRMLGHINGRTYELKPETIFTSKYVVRLDGVKVGHIGPRPVLFPHSAEFPDELTLAQQVFLVALASLMWARDNN